MHIKTFVFNPFAENTYLVWDDHGETAVFDPGFYTQEEETEFIDFVQSERLNLKHCLLTHAHIDHIFGCQKIKDKYNLKPKLHAQDLMMYQSGSQLARMYGFPEVVFPAHELFEEDINQYSIGSLTFQILFTPGHSPGSVSYYNLENSTLLSGDVLFEGSIGRTDLPGGNFDLLIHSIKTQLLILPKDTKVLSGHGGITSIGQEILTNPFL